MKRQGIAGRLGALEEAVKRAQRQPVTYVLLCGPETSEEARNRPARYVDIAPQPPVVESVAQ